MITTRAISRGLSAITGGFIYRGTEIPALRGHYILGDIVTGRVFHVPLTALKLGRQSSAERAHPQTGAASR